MSIEKEVRSSRMIIVCQSRTYGMNGGIVTEEMKVYVHLYSFEMSVGGSRTFRQGGPSNGFF